MASEKRREALEKPKNSKKEYKVSRACDYWKPEEVSKKTTIQRFAYPDDVDVELLPLLDLINVIPGVRTLFSCCGHGKEPFYMVLAFTSLQTRSWFEQIFAKHKFVKDFDDVAAEMPKDFLIEDFNDHQLCNHIFEDSVGFYSTSLGTSKKSSRVKVYKLICKCLLKLVPNKQW